MSSPTQRTLDRLRSEGWTCQSVEKHAPRFAGKMEIKGRLQSVFTLTTRIDLFGCIDVIAIRDGETLGIQATGGGNNSHRLAKIRAEPRMQAWLAANNRLEIWEWRQVVAYKADGTKAKVKRWQPRIEVVTLEAFEEPKPF